MLLSLQAELVTPVKGSILEAGKHAELAVTVYDSFGNITSDLAGHAIEATAHGPATVQFVQSPDGVRRYCCQPLVFPALSNSGALIAAS